MNYYQLREIIKTGDRVFERTKFKPLSPKTYLSASIRFIAGIKYNHVGIVIKMLDGKYYVHEALAEGIVLTPFKDWIKGKQILIKRSRYEPEEEKDLKKRMLELVKRKYDYEGLLAHQFFWNTLGVWIGAKTEQEALETLYCYEDLWYRDRYYLGEKWFQQTPKKTIHTYYTRTLYEGKPK